MPQWKARYDTLNWAIIQHSDYSPGKHDGGGLLQAQRVTQTHTKSSIQEMEMASLSWK